MVKLSLWERIASRFFRCFQDRNADWMAVAFRDDPTDLPERRARFIEEALEFDQSLGGSAAEAHALVDYVYGRPVGVPHQELGGTMVCLAGLAEFASLDMDRAGEDELKRVSTPEMLDKIRRKRGSRHGRGPLPGFSFPDGPRIPTKPASFSGDELRDALRPFVGHYQPWMDDWDDDAPCSTFSRVTFGDLRRARALLEAPSG